MRRIMARPVADADLDAMWTLVSRDDGAARLPAIIGYIAELKRFWRRWIGALTRLDLLALVAWGQRPRRAPGHRRRARGEIPGRSACAGRTWVTTRRWRTQRGSRRR
ncbi:MAG: hypothetical protein R3A52_23530 [Polyangiales bacterium]